jgi:Na+(H+)/acetate symporter ActP
MNTKLILFSGVVTALVGSGIGFTAAGLFPTPYSSQMYQNLDRKYAIVGCVAGLLVGSCQEMIREAKAEQDARDDLLEDLKRVLHSRKL